MGADEAGAQHEHVADAFQVRSLWPYLNVVRAACCLNQLVYVHGDMSENK